MLELVSAEWVEQRLGSNVQLVDPRTRERYLSGHPAGAIHAPIRQVFDADGRLLDDERLAEWLGERGVSSDPPVAVYDDYDCQKGALLAWILEYLGHRNVALLESPFAQWHEEGRELFYRPVTAEVTVFQLDPRPELRASSDEARAAAGGALLDVRSLDEYTGDGAAPDESAGHIPDARHAAWLTFVRNDKRLFVDAAEVERLLDEAGLTRIGPTVVYCHSGPRAAVAVLAMRLAGVEARLYDGSFLDWTRNSLPVEHGKPAHMR